MTRPRVVVAAWTGSTNLGDELITRATLTMLADLGAEPVVVSVKPTATEAQHHAPAASAGLRSVRRSLLESDAMLFGPGGLLQDETGIWNLPFHLSRIWAANRTRKPWAGIGLGAVGVGSRIGRQLVRRGLTGHTTLVVRDTPNRWSSFATSGLHAYTSAPTWPLPFPRPLARRQTM